MLEQVKKSSCINFEDEQETGVSIFGQQKSPDLNSIYYFPKVL